MNEAPFKIDELDPPFSWEDSPPAYRHRMPTLKDFDPRRQDAIPASRPRSRESMPTLPDIDPLRHDQPS